MSEDLTEKVGIAWMEDLAKRYEEKKMEEKKEDARLKIVLQENEALKKQLFELQKREEESAVKIKKLQSELEETSDCLNARSMELDESRDKVEKLACEYLEARKREGIAVSNAANMNDEAISKLKNENESMFYAIQLLVDGHDSSLTGFALARRIVAKKERREE